MSETEHTATHDEGMEDPLDCPEWVLRGEKEIGHFLNACPFVRFRLTVELDEAVREAVAEAALIVFAIETEEDVGLEPADWMHSAIDRSQQGAPLSFEALRQSGYITAEADVGPATRRAVKVLFEAGHQAIEEAGGMVNAISDLLVEKTDKGLCLQVNQMKNVEGDETVLLGAIAVVRALQEHYGAPPVGLRWAVGREDQGVDVGAAFIEPGQPVLLLDCAQWLKSEEKGALGRILRRNNSRLH